MIRQLVPADVQDYRRIRLEGLLHDPLAFMMVYGDWSGRPIKDFADRLRAITMFAAFDEGKIVGTVGLEADHTAPDIGWIVEVYVTRAQRGAGISDGLMEYAINHQSYDALQLEVAVTNARARALYARHGFKVIARDQTEQQAKNGTVCEVLMERNAR